MPLDKKTLKAHLLERYTAHLDEMLAQLESDEQLHLTAIEERALELRQQVGQSATEALAVNESQQQAVHVSCPTCQQVMRYKDRKRKWLKHAQAMSK